ncbi:UDP-N-acetylglucosamine 2-epimerase (hydrolyzing) [Halomonas litopenaei]|nr:UDP-N-acetylglucosamine 2-epimerase (hydrolyzing) [Halomonas litopenaei]
MTPRKIWVLTSSRADYGLLYWLLREIDEDPALELMLVASGSHLSTEFGSTVSEIERDGFRLHRRLEILLASDSRNAMTKAMGLALLSVGDALVEDRPDLVVLLGDRFEIVPVALAAVTHGITLAHLHGGETSRGALDEYYRHAVTKLANLHFPATEVYRRRILQMGEDPGRVFVHGAPGIDHLYRSRTPTRAVLARALDMPLDRPTALVTYHPVTAGTGEDVEALIAALSRFEDLDVLVCKANADCHGRSINARLARWCAERPEARRLVDSLGQRLYHGCLEHMDVLVGNSSSGLIEAPSFRRPVVNVGKRQDGRLKAANVINVEASEEAIAKGIETALSETFKRSLGALSNPYDPFEDGAASRRIKNTLKRVNLDAGIREKWFFDIDEVSPLGGTASPTKGLMG